MLLLVVDTAGPSGGVLLAGIGGNNGDEGSAAEILGVIDLHPRQFSAELIPAIVELLQANRRLLEMWTRLRWFLARDRLPAFEWV